MNNEKNQKIDKNQSLRDEVLRKVSGGGSLNRVTCKDCGYIGGVSDSEMDGECPLCGSKNVSYND